MKKGHSYRFLTHNGETRTLSEWSRLIKIPHKTISDRIDKMGWTIKEALETPPLKHMKVKSTHPKEYRAWCHMKERCYNINDRFYPRYGGRGIKVCPEWVNNYPQFLSDIGTAPTQKHTIDRIDNDKDYEPNNVRWATHKEQANNRSGIRLKMIEFNGQRKNLSDWAKSTGIKLVTITTRLNALGWTIERALTEPVRHKNKN